MRREFEEEDARLEKKEAEWEGEVERLREDFEKCCRELGGKMAGSVVQGKASVTNQKIDQAVEILQELLSEVADEQQRSLILQV